MPIKSYAYLITCTATKEFYFGSRYGNIRLERSAQEDLWVKYFTSSPVVRTLIKTYGREQFIAEVLSEFDDKDECFWYEQDRIYENKDNDLCLNRYYMIRENGSHKFLRLGPVTPESKIKMSASAKARCEKRSAIEAEAFYSRQAASLKANHAARSSEKKEQTRLRKIAAYKSKSLKELEAISQKQSEAATKRWAAWRLTRQNQEPQAHP
jgi:hypothetical protein